MLKTAKQHCQQNAGLMKVAGDIFEKTTPKFSCCWAGLPYLKPSSWHTKPSW